MVSISGKLRSFSRPLNSRAVRLVCLCVPRLIVRSSVHLFVRFACRLPFNRVFFHRFVVLFSEKHRILPRSDRGV